MLSHFLHSLTFSLCPSFSLSLSLSLSFSTTSLSLSVPPSLFLCPYFLSLSVHPSLSLSLSLSLSFSTTSLSLSVPPSLFLCPYLSFSLPHLSLSFSTPSLSLHTGHHLVLVVGPPVVEVVAEAGHHEAEAGLGPEAAPPARGQEAAEHDLGHGEAVPPVVVLDLAAIVLLDGEQPSETKRGDWPVSGFVSWPGPETIKILPDCNSTVNT